MSSAREKAEARRAKLMAKNAERMKKLTENAESEGRVLSDDIPAIAPELVASSSQSKTNDNEDGLKSLNAKVTPVITEAGDPDDVDISALAEKPTTFSDFAGAENRFGNDLFGGNNPFASALNSTGNGSNGPPMGGSNNPFMSPESLGQGRSHPFLQRVLPLIHIFSMVALGIYACFFLEPSRNEHEKFQFSHWASLSKRNPTTHSGRQEISTIPLLWFFTTIEVILYSTQSTLNLMPPPSPLLSLLANIGLPAPFGSLVKTGMSVFQFASTVFTDLSVLIMTISAVIVVSNNALHHGWVSVPYVGDLSS